MAYATSFAPKQENTRAVWEASVYVNFLSGSCGARKTNQFTPHKPLFLAFSSSGYYYCTQTITPRAECGGVGVRGGWRRLGTSPTSSRQKTGTLGGVDSLRSRFFPMMAAKGRALETFSRWSKFKEVWEKKGHLSRPIDPISSMKEAITQSHFHPVGPYRWATRLIQDNDFIIPRLERPLP